MLVSLVAYEVRCKILLTDWIWVDLSISVSSFLVDFVGYDQSVHIEVEAWTKKVHNSAQVV